MRLCLLLCLASVAAKDTRSLDSLLSGLANLVSGGREKSRPDRQPGFGPSDKPKIPEGQSAMLGKINASAPGLFRSAAEMAALIGPFQDVDNASLVHHHYDEMTAKLKQWALDFPDITHLHRSLIWSIDGI